MATLAQDTYQAETRLLWAEGHLNRPETAHIAAQVRNALNAVRLVRTTHGFGNYTFTVETPGRVGLPWQGDAGGDAQ